jgi:hypothetical protein
MLSDITVTVDAKQAAEPFCAAAAVAPGFPAALPLSPDPALARFATAKAQGDTQCPQPCQEVVELLRIEFPLEIDAINAAKALQAAFGNGMHFGRE